MRDGKFCELLARKTMSFGGNTVDKWLREHLHLGNTQLDLDEASRVRISLSDQNTEFFLFENKKIEISR